MQTIKEKLNDMSAMRKAKAEAKEEEKEEKELAKARVEVAHEVRMAREAEAEMDLHVNKAVKKVAEHEQKHAHQSGAAADMPDSYSNPGYNSTDPSFGGGADCRETGGAGSTATVGTGHISGPPTHNKLL
ncbi:hypothetical protein BUALT_Bualt01G0184800 [Buddleja alternifolia]|uniref:Late embryogenesis abundant protein n=1 Tax=Buddleja alternifolia TaxID=168488 RepID=A0AAV6YEN8_9LAMI|nr:hypothetical protein BUALT_Bualt01G0184800 [Buddleja alternifolia]